MDVGLGSLPAAFYLQPRIGADAWGARRYRRLRCQSLVAPFAHRPKGVLAVAEDVVRTSYGMIVTCVAYQGLQTFLARLATMRSNLLSNWAHSLCATAVCFCTRSVRGVSLAGGCSLLRGFRTFRCRSPRRRLAALFSTLMSRGVSRVLAAP